MLKKTNIKIFLVSNKDSKYKEIIPGELKEYSFKIFESFNQAYYSVYASPPQLIVIGIENLSLQFNTPCGDGSFQESNGSYMTQLKLINDMQLDNMLSNIPILYILPANFNFETIKDGQIDRQSSKYYLKDYIKEPLSTGEISYKINSILCSSKSALDANPLTKLPGNSSIMGSIKNKIDENIDFSFSYIDIDNFKSYNDKYGFVRGDEVIMMTSRLIATTVYDISKTRRRDIEKYVLVGHIGGDDFTVVSHAGDALDIANTIIYNFDKIILSFYDNTDKERGYIEAYDRQKILRQFPIMSLSISIIPNANKKITHYGQISEITSALKSSAKESIGSKVVIDKRERG
ncbi:MAG: GGDEF domain-containing protein [Deltaproteobacteria bacterium]|nr:GGDEF domain-containing protein [Deltaproteobacteria bacterium]